MDLPPAEGKQNNLKSSFVFGLGNISPELIWDFEPITFLKYQYKKFNQSRQNCFINSYFDLINV